MVTWAGMSKKSPVIVMSVLPPRLPVSGNTDSISARDKKQASKYRPGCDPDNNIIIETINNLFLPLTSQD